MEVHPDAERFMAAYETATPQVVWTTLVADLETPVSAMLKESPSYGSCPNSHRPSKSPVNRHPDGTQQ